jgi:hypothetical protein
MSMLRVAADCDEVPPEVLTLVQELAQFSRRHIRKVSYPLRPIHVVVNSHILCQAMRPVCHSL